MKKLIIIVCTLFFAFIFEACDLIDGTGVENPDLTIEQALAQPQSAERWTNGLKERVAVVYNDFLVTAELTTDNYVNNETFFNQNVDNGTLRDVDDDFDDTQFQIGKLREQAEFGLTEILVNNDPNAAGTELEAEMHFYKGFANLLAGELFTTLPSDGDAAAVAPAQHFQNAVQDFQNALSIDNSSETAISYYLGLARAYYNLGEQSNAESAANDAIALDGNDDYVRMVEFDGVNGPFSSMQDAVYDRASFDDLQPLPRLDFLDPKYGQDGDTESSIPMFKIEEAYLIIAESQLAGGNLGPAQNTLNDLLTIVSNRPTRAFNELAEERVEADEETQRPNTSATAVKADADAPARPGLVLDRTANTVVPTISGTSVSSAMVNGLTDTGVEAIELLYLLRQEIFFGEGRRIFDLGIRWPVSENEGLINENITDSDRQPTIPSYLPPIADFDSFAPLPCEGCAEVTISVNLNAAIASGRGYRF